jgi:hypothetical protein
MPQFDKKGRIIGPRLYARLYKAGYAGIKAGNRTAEVAIGETSNQGRDHPARGSANESVAPGTFARLLAQTKGLRFDAYAEHPYATRPNLPPTQKVRFPNVTMTQLPHFEKMLDVWFKRKNIPLWITEYGYETKPGEPAGVTNAQQAAYMSRVIRQLRADDRVQMFIWFIFRDSKQSLWQSGLMSSSGAQKPAYRTFSALAQATRGETVTVKPGVSPTLTVAVPRIASQTSYATQVGVDYSVFEKGKLITTDQAAPPLRIDQSVSFRISSLVPVAGHTYTVEMDVNDPSGNHSTWTYVLVAPGAAKKK